MSCQDDALVLRYTQQKQLVQVHGRPSRLMMFQLWQVLPPVALVKFQYHQSMTTTRTALINYHNASTVTYIQTSDQAHQAT